MKVGILAGGLGTRLSEETVIKPKPMVELGGWPILWHIMKGYGAAGFDEFVLGLGYKAEVIKDFFVHYRQRVSSFSLSLASGDIRMHQELAENWQVHLLDTGLHTQTGGRVRQIAEFVGNESFCLTYGDGVSNVNLQELLAFHKRHGKLATMTAIRPPSRYGMVSFTGEEFMGFKEKPQGGEGWINGGFFILEPGILDYIDTGSDVVWEQEPLERLFADNQLAAFQHDGFWACMDTLRDVQQLNQLWAEGRADWKTW